VRDTGGSYTLRSATIVERASKKNESGGKNERGRAWGKGGRVRERERLGGSDRESGVLEKRG
jgi:hypothetical protein